MQEPNENRSETPAFDLELALVRLLGSLERLRDKLIERIEK